MKPTQYTPLSMVRLGWSVGLAGVVFYVGCLITMSTVSHETAVVFFNSLLHGIDVEPILRTDVPLREVLFGIVTTFVLGWFAGAMIAGFYNWGLKPQIGENVPETHA